MAAMSEDEREAFRAERREAGLRINPETAIYASRSFWRSAARGTRRWPMSCG
jgi:hypothetical protein